MRTPGRSSKNRADEGSRCIDKAPFAHYTGGGDRACHVDAGAEANTDGTEQSQAAGNAITASIKAKQGHAGPGKVGRCLIVGGACVAVVAGCMLVKSNPLGVITSVAVGAFRGFRRRG
jgi:hypothetical protein